MLMNLSEQRRSAQALSSNVRAGVTLPEAMRDLAHMQPEYADHWSKAEVAISAGNLLFESLEGVWPSALVRAVHAGEEAGQLEAVLKHIVKALAIQNDISTELKGLRFPAGVLGFGLLTFVLLMVFAVPKTARSLRVEDANELTQLSLLMESFFKNYWIPFGFVMGVAIVKLTTWIQTEEGRAAALEFGLKIPQLRDPLRNLYFGLWCEYMSLMVRAGITVPKALELTAPVLPPSLRPGLELMRRDLVDFNLQLEEAVNLDRLLPGDPRHEWPRFIRQVFVVGGRTGSLDEELSSVSPMLIEEGVATLKAFCKSAEVFATIAGVGCAVICFVGVYSPIIGMIQHQ